jgi:hypothetical protein
MTACRVFARVSISTVLCFLWRKVLNSFNDLQRKTAQNGSKKDEKGAILPADIRSTFRVEMQRKLLMRVGFWGGGVKSRPTRVSDRLRPTRVFPQNEISKF